MPAEPIESLITRLVQEAPVIDPAVVSDLIARLGERDEPLARSLAQVIELVATGRIDPGIALPALAMACATLVDPALTAREHEAARFEIETLLPLPDDAARPSITPPDVPLTALRRH